MWLRIYQHVLPRAKAWLLTAEKFLRNLFEGLVQLPADIKTYADLVYLDKFPQTTRCLDEWEQEYALPDTGLTEQQRRDRLDGRIKSLGGQSPRYIQDALQAEGFDVYLHEWWWPDIPQFIDITGTGTAIDTRLYLFNDLVNDKAGYGNGETFLSSDQVCYFDPSGKWQLIDFSVDVWEHPISTDFLPPKTGWDIGALPTPAPTIVYSDPFTTRNPLLYLRRGQGLVTYLNECGEALAECGEALAECGETLEPTGYPLVNKFIQTKADTRTLCGEPVMECGEEEAVCGNFLELVDEQKEYIISGNPDTFPYFLYIGGAVFPEHATIDSKRRDEFEALCLKICPCQQWLGMLINYS